MILHQKYNKIMKIGRPFKKGYKPWNKGKTLSEKHKQALRGKRKPFSLESRKNMSGRVPYNKGLKGYKHSGSFKKGHPNLYGFKKGKHASKRTEFKIGENHPSWKDGISFEPYTSEFNGKLKRQIRKRDKFICQLCGITEKQSIKRHKRVLSVNHIDFDKRNCNQNNLNTLCIRCNSMVTHDREKWTLFFKEKMKNVKS